MERIKLTLTPLPVGLSTVATVTPEAITVKCGDDDPILTPIDTASWRRLIRLLEKQKVWKWPGEVHNQIYYYGLSWSLEVQTTDINVTRVGLNAYPPSGRGTHWGTNFRKLVDTISEMDGDGASHFQNIYAVYRRMSA